DTVYFRGGTYAYTRATTSCASQTARVDAITLNKAGTSGNPIRYWAYPHLRTDQHPSPHGTGSVHPERGRQPRAQHRLA
ncbi:MAG TPA: hypothetical protein VLL08_06505, partial [Kineosporiaceae bacterium]|nr:hypothetical protein [Kineosporiaceae bacterium]